MPEKHEQIITAISAIDNMTLDIWANMHKKECENTNSNLCHLSFEVYQHINAIIEEIVRQFNLRAVRVTTDNIVNIQYFLPYDFPMFEQFHELLRMRNYIVINPNEQYVYELLARKDIFSETNKIKLNYAID